MRRRGRPGLCIRCHVWALGLGSGLSQTHLLPCSLKQCLYFPGAPTVASMARNLADLLGVDRTHGRRLAFWCRRSWRQRRKRFTVGGVEYHWHRDKPAGIGDRGVVYLMDEHGDKVASVTTKSYGMRHLISWQPLPDGSYYLGQLMRVREQEAETR